MKRKKWDRGGDGVATIVIRLTEAVMTNAAPLLSPQKGGSHVKTNSRETLRWK